MKKFLVCCMLLLLAFAGNSYAKDRIERSTLDFIYGNSTLNKYSPSNASTPVYATAGSFLDLSIITNSSSTSNYVQVEKLVDWGNGTLYNVGTTPGNWLYSNGNASDDGYPVTNAGSNKRWRTIAFSNATGQFTSFYAAASGADAVIKEFFAPVGGWYRIRAVGWSDGDYKNTYAANCTNASLRVRLP